MFIVLTLLGLIALVVVIVALVVSHRAPHERRDDIDITPRSPQPTSRGDRAPRR